MNQYLNIRIQNYTLSFQKIFYGGVGVKLNKILNKKYKVLMSRTTIFKHINEPIHTLFSSQNYNIHTLTETTETKNQLFHTILCILQT